MWNIFLKYLRTLKLLLLLLFLIAHEFFLYLLNVFLMKYSHIYRLHLFLKAEPKLVHF